MSLGVSYIPSSLMILCRGITWNVLARGPVLCWGHSPRHPSMAARNKVCMSRYESRWHVNKSLDMNMYKCIRKCIQWAFHPWIMTWYIYVLVEFIVHDLWDMPVLAEPRLTTYVRVVGTKGKHVSDTWDGMQVWVVFGRWEWITWPCTHISHMTRLYTCCFMIV